MLSLPLAFLLLAAMQPAPSERPAPPFISPMGEPFRLGSPAEGLERWFAGADADADGSLVSAELKRDGARFFLLLDSDRDGEIEPEEMARYEYEIAPEIQLGRDRLTERQRRRLWRNEQRREEARGGAALVGGRRPARAGLEGAGRFGLLNIPQPVMGADADLNRGVSAAEFAAAAGRRFPLLDTDHDGRLTRPELLALLPRLPVPGRVGR